MCAIQILSMYRVERVYAIRSPPLLQNVHGRIVVVVRYGLCAMHPSPDRGEKT